MKKKLLNLTLLVTLLLLTACGSRIPFIEKQISDDLALVYIYVSDDTGTEETISDSPFTIRINNKNTKTKIKMNEYLPFYMKTNKTKISIVRASIEEESLELNLNAGKIYYLRVDTNLDFNRFSLTQIDNKIASKEIQKTGLAGSFAVEEDKIVTEVVDSIDNNSKNISKTDEIKKAYKLMIDGILTQKEYSKLKAEILAR